MFLPSSLSKPTTPGCEFGPSWCLEIDSVYRALWEGYLDRQAYDYLRLINQFTEPDEDENDKIARDLIINQFTEPDEDENDKIARDLKTASMHRKVVRLTNEQDHPRIYRAIKAWDKKRELNGALWLSYLGALAQMGYEEEASQAEDILQQHLASLAE